MPRNNNPGIWGRGRELAREWGVPVAPAGAAYYHKDGHWYMAPEVFPAAYFDDHGYVRFRARADFEGDPRLRIGAGSCNPRSPGRRVNVPGGIASLPGYRRMR
jgi:hypothetical protein